MSASLPMSFRPGRRVNQTTMSAMSGPHVFGQSPSEPSGRVCRTGGVTAARVDTHENCPTNPDVHVSALSAPAWCSRRRRTTSVCLPWGGVNVRKDRPHRHTAIILTASTERDRIRFLLSEWGTAATSCLSQQKYIHVPDRRHDESYTVVRFDPKPGLVKRITSIRSRPPNMCTHCCLRFGAFADALMALTASKLKTNVRPDMLSLKSRMSVYTASFGRASTSWRRGNSN